MVKQIVNKFVAMLIILALTMGNLLLVATESYAAYEELEQQKIVSSDKNVSFDTYFYVGENIHSVTLDIAKESIINFEINVGDGYLKNPVIELSNRNFDITGIEYQNIDGIVESFEANKIMLNQISSKTKVIISAKIKLNHGDVVEADYLGRETTAIFSGNYTNIKGKTSEISLNIAVRIDWLADATSNIDENVEKYMFLNNKTIIQTKVTSGINESVLPIKNTNINIAVPKINDVYPEEIRVRAKSTVATNGISNGNYFGTDNYKYDKETGVLQINVENNPNSENKISWKNGTDEYIINYIYEGVQNVSSIKLRPTNNITTYKDVQAANGTEKEVEIAPTGNNVNFSINANESISKGFMYAASNYETEYKSIWEADISYVDATDILIFQQNTDKFIEESGKAEYVNSYYKQIKVNRDNFNKILGQDGKIEIYNIDTLIGEINKDTGLDENGNYIFEVQGEVANLMIKTTKPVTEGRIVIENTKKITAQSPYTFEQIKTFKTIENSLVGSSLNQEVQDLKVNTNLTETSTKSSIQIGKENLSTIVTNKDVEIRAVLEADDITDDLYKNPTIEIALPEEVQKIDIKSGNILFADQMEIASLEIVDNNIIRLVLSGEQTNFITDGNKGITIILNVDLTLNRTSPSREAQTTMKVTNEKAVTIENDGISVAQTNIVAPTGIIALNSVSNTKTGEMVTSLEKDEEGLTIERNTAKQIATYTDTIINNNEVTISNVKIIGNIPTENDSMGSTLNAKIASNIISAEGVNYTVYYTANKDANSDINDMNNGWSTEIVENTAQYMIAINENIEQGRILNFSYNLELPENLEYGEKAISTYKVEYTEGEMASGEVASTSSIPFIKYAVAEADQTPAIQTQPATPVSLSTGDGVVLEAKLEDNLVDNTTYQGSYVTYTVKVENKGSITANNVVARMDIPEGLVYATTDGGSYAEDETIKTAELQLGTIEAGKTATGVIYLGVTGNIENEIKLKANIKCDELEEMYSNEISLKTGENIVEEVTFHFENDSNTPIVGRESVFYMDIINEESTINNLEIKIQIPEEYNYNDVELYNMDKLDEKDMPEEVSSSNFTKSYKDGILTINIKKLDFELDLELTLTPNKEMAQSKLTALLSYDRKSQIVSTKDLQIKKLDVSAKIDATYGDGAYIKNGDIVKYTITLTNNGGVNSSQLLSLKYADEFEFEYLKILVDGEEITTKNSTDLELVNNLIVFQTDVLVNSSKVIEISVPLSIEGTQNKEISNTLELYNLNIKNIYKYKIEKNNDSDKPEDNEKEKTYNISGTAWVDTDNNGKMDDSENKLSGIPVKAINSTGEEKASTTTSENGTYTLENLPAGDYTVIFEYDSSKYILTKYQADGIEESVNSNVIESNLNGRKVATTNTIKISDRNIANINIGLVQGTKFDLSLNKKVTQISMVNSKRKLELAYDTQLAKMDLDYQYIDSTNLAVVYEITITNEGDVPGYATKIVDYLPKEFDFSSELNKDWYKQGNNIETKVLANNLINPGESQTVTLVLTKSMTENDNGIICNTAEIAETYNEFALKDSDSTPGNNKEGEDDISSANVILGLRTGGPVTYIALTLGIMALITFGAYEINKRVLKSFDERR